jgi:hypothetical protein
MVGADMSSGLWTVSAISAAILALSAAPTGLAVFGIAEDLIFDIVWWFIPMAAMELAVCSKHWILRAYIRNGLICMILIEAWTALSFLAIPFLCINRVLLSGNAIAWVAHLVIVWLCVLMGTLMPAYHR